MLAVASAFGQASDGNITGTVLDASGAAIPNATVQLENAATGVKLSTKTDASGSYRFGNVLIGRYSITVSNSGFTTSRGACADPCVATADQDIAEDAVPIWSETPETPEAHWLRHRDEQSIRDLVSALPEPFREALVLREVHDLSYREIAEIVAAPVGTVMSRLARARSMLRAAWMAAEEKGQ